MLMEFFHILEKDVCTEYCCVLPEKKAPMKYDDIITSLYSYDTASHLSIWTWQSSETGYEIHEVS